MKTGVRNKRFKFKQQVSHTDGRELKSKGFYSRNGKPKRKKKIKTH